MDEISKSISNTNLTLSQIGYSGSVHRQVRFAMIEPKFLIVSRIREKI